MTKLTPDQLAAHRLLWHLHATEDRWFKISHALLCFGRWRVPEHREPRNPVQWVAVKIGVWMDAVQERAINDLFDEHYRLGRYKRG